MGESDLRETAAFRVVEAARPVRRCKPKPDWESKTVDAFYFAFERQVFVTRESVHFL